MRIILQVTMLNTWSTHCAIVHENQGRPYGRRQVTIDLTPEQVEQLQPKVVGQDGADDRHEEIGEVWLEVEHDGQPGLDTGDGGR